MKGALQVYHPSGTVAQGVVVDDRMHVIGTKNLIVSDASVAVAGWQANSMVSSYTIGAYTALVQ